MNSAPSGAAPRRGAVSYIASSDVFVKLPPAGRFLCRQRKPSSSRISQASFSRFMKEPGKLASVRSFLLSTAKSLLRGGMGREMRTPPWPGGGGHGGTLGIVLSLFSVRSGRFARKRRSRRISELCPFGAKRSHEPGDDDGAPLVTFPASGKSRPRKGPQPCFSASRGSQSAAAGERPQALFILPPRQEAGNGPVRRKMAQPCGLRLLTHLGQ